MPVIIGDSIVFPGLHYNAKLVFIFPDLVLSKASVDHQTHVLQLFHLYISSSSCPVVLRYRYTVPIFIVCEMRYR